MTPSAKNPTNSSHEILPSSETAKYVFILSPDDEILPDDKILDSSKLKEFADDDFKFDENGRKLSEQVENTVGKGEIACYEQFLRFPQCFQKACFPGASKGVIVWEWVKSNYMYYKFWGYRILNLLTCLF